MTQILKNLSHPLAWGGLLGASAVIIGAFGSHALESRFTVSEMESFRTASRYHLIHSVLLVALGVSTFDTPLRITTCFVSGVILFSGSIYLLLTMDLSKLGIITPIGGTLLIAGWIQLALDGLGFTG